MNFTCSRDEPSSTLETCANAVWFFKHELAVDRASWSEKPHMGLTYTQYQALMLQTEKKLAEAYATIRRLSQKSSLERHDPLDTKSSYIRPGASPATTSAYATGKFGGMTALGHLATCYPFLGFTQIKGTITVPIAGALASSRIVRSGPRPTATP